ncbi:response regulator transcription factor [Cellulomonas sp. McL0617]|uniref:response regulator transcription factor n=1 Tax=Cellulomonas sp. McL0617 TaxID=3415675 RepID=UPI003CF4C83F
MRVLVVDDHPVFRDGLVALLRTLPDVEVAGLAGDGETAVELVAAGGVDVVLMDLNLPGRSGIAATAAIVALPDPPAVLVVTMVDDDGAVASALRAGARGYLLKGSTGQQIADAVRTVAGGGVVLGPGVATYLLTAPTPTADPDGLTVREREILSLLAEGASNAQIARTLGLSLKTVQNYTSRVLAKLQVADRTQAALRARGPLRP